MRLLTATSSIVSLARENAYFLPPTRQFLVESFTINLGNVNAAIKRSNYPAVSRVLYIRAIITRQQNSRQMYKRIIDTQHNDYYFCL